MIILFIFIQFYQQIRSNMVNSKGNIWQPNSPWSREVLPQTHFNLNSAINDVYCQQILTQTNNLNMNQRQQPLNSASHSERYFCEESALDTSMKVRTSLQREAYDQSCVYLGPNTDRDRVIPEEEHEESSRSNINNRVQASVAWREFIRQKRPTEGQESEYYLKLLKGRPPRQTMPEKRSSLPNLPGVTIRTNSDSENIEIRIKKLEEILMMKLQQEAVLTDRKEDMVKPSKSEKLISMNSVPELKKQPTSSSLLSKKRNKAITHFANPESAPKSLKQKIGTSPTKNRKKQQFIRPAQNKYSPVCVSAMDIRECSTKKKERIKDHDKDCKVTPHLHVSFKKTVKKLKSIGRKDHCNSRSNEKKRLRNASEKMTIQQLILNLQERMERVRNYITIGDLTQIERELQLMKIIEQMHSRVLQSIKGKLLPAERQMLKSSKALHNVAVSLRNRYG